MDNKYIGITIGPITRVISIARKTRGMWAASYIFSYIARNLIEPFKDRGFLLPAIKEEMFTTKYAGAGIFPDRYIFRAENEDFETLVIKVNQLFGSLAGRISANDSETPAVLQQLRDRLKIYFFECTREESLSDSSFIKECEQRLAMLEQQDTFAPSVEHDYLAEFLNGKMDSMRFLMDDAGLGERFKSIVEISSGDDDVKMNLPALPYQRYVAVVYADGDSMGKALESPEITTADLSSALLAFNIRAIHLVNEFEGQPVFVGGDDLFFFAPIYSKVNSKSVFTLLCDLSTAFQESLGLKKITGPTLSFGLAVTYCKFPMQEAVELSRQLLSEAKGYSVQDESAFGSGHFKLKNNILFSVQKHSGHTRGALLHKGFEETVKAFDGIADRYLCPQDEAPNKAGDVEARAQMLRSLMHNQREHAAMLEVAVTSTDLLNNYFDNFYNEDIHVGYSDFFNQVKELLLQAYVDYQSAPAAIELCYALLQFIHLVNSKPKDETV